MLKTVPSNDRISVADLTHDPYRYYLRMRAETPVLKMKSIRRIMLTKAADTKAVKDDPVTFSSDDPNTPMKRSFRAHTLMRKDGAEHLAERNAMAAAYGAKALKEHWMPLYERIADTLLDGLDTSGPVDLFTALAGPYAAECLKHLLGIQNAHQSDVQRWSQTLIDGAGNFGWDERLFQKCDQVNDEIDACMEAMEGIHRAEKGPSAFSCMVNADNPIPLSQQRANIKIAIGGGVNEPRDALLTVIYGLLSNPDQLKEVREQALWMKAFEEAIRWVAPIQVSSRFVTADTEIRGYAVPKGESVMTVQASANHDEELYGDPHLFNVFRKSLVHQAFGNGPHFCQGTHVARRMIGVLMLPKLFERFPDIRLVDPAAVRFTGFGFRGPVSLPVFLA